MKPMERKVLAILGILLFALAIRTACSAQEQSVVTNKNTGVTVEYEYFDHEWNGDTVKLAYIRLYRYKINKEKVFRAETYDAVMLKMKEYIASQKKSAYKPFKVYKSDKRSEFKYTGYLYSGKLVLTD